MSWRRAGVVAAALGLLTLTLPADAATTTGFADWTFAGSTTAYTGTMQLPGLGYPEATFTSDSRSGSVGVVSGTSFWFGANSPPGTTLGSSRNNPYLNLRPRADNAASPSVTTYTFATPAPTGWGFVLGDIDADKVQVSATLAGGTAATAAQLGFRDVFNVCDTTPRPSGCGAAQSTPTWDPATTTLNGNDDATDTYGGSAWFYPTARLKTLTFTYTQRSGLPVYQTWFAAVNRDVTGTVTATAGQCDLPAATVQLIGPDGAVLASTHPNADGGYAFDHVAASAGFTVHLSEVPPGCEATGTTTAPVDLSERDATADFTLRETVIGTVTGSVTDPDGEPVDGATVVVSGPDGLGGRAVPGADGTYSITDLPPGTYQLIVRPPAGFEVVGGATRNFVVPDTGGTIEQNVVLRPVPAATPSATPSATPPASPRPRPAADIPSTSGGSDIPDTGGPSILVAGAGALMVVLGSVALTLGHRRRR